MKPNGQRAKNAILLTWILLALEIISLVSSGLQLNMLHTIANGGYVPDEASAANDMREGAIGIIYFIDYTVWLVFFLMWFRRAYYNLHQKINYLERPAGAAVWTWFVPIVCLYRPYQIMKELFTETKKLLSAKGFADKVGYTTDWLGWWWTLWIITAFVANIIFRVTLRGAETIDEFMFMTITQIVSSVLEIPLALLFIKIIKDYSEVEPLLEKPEEALLVPEETV